MGNHDHIRWVKGFNGQGYPSGGTISIPKQYSNGYFYAVVCLILDPETSYDTATLACDGNTNAGWSVYSDLSAMTTDSGHTVLVGILDKLYYVTDPDEILVTWDVTALSDVDPGPMPVFNTCSVDLIMTELVTPTVIRSQADDANPFDLPISDTGVNVVAVWSRLWQPCDPAASFNPQRIGGDGGVVHSLEGSMHLGDMNMWNVWANRYYDDPIFGDNPDSFGIFRATPSTTGFGLVAIGIDFYGIGGSGSLSGTLPSGTGPSGTGPSGTGPSGTGPSGTLPSGTGPSGGSSGGSGSSGSGGCDTPVITFVSPTHGSTVISESIPVIATITCLDPITAAALYVDDVLVDGAPVIDGDTYTFTWDAAGFTKDSHQLKVKAWNDCGKWSSKWITITLICDPPHITIISPVHGNTIADNSVTVTATITSVDTITTARLYIAGLLVDGAPTIDGDTYTFTWDTELWDNTSYQLKVKAWTDCNRWASKWITITLARSLANMTADVVTLPLPAEGSEDLWVLDDVELRRGIETMKIFSTSENPALNFIVTQFVRTFATRVAAAATGSWLLDSFQRILNRRSFYLPSGKFFRLGWRFRPTFVESSNVYPTCDSEFARYVQIIDDVVYFIGLGPAPVDPEDDYPVKLWSFDGTSITEVVDLSAYENDYDIYGFGLLGNRWYFPFRHKTDTEKSIIYVYDLDTGELPYRLMWRETDYQPSVMATAAGKLWFGTTDKDIDEFGRIYTFDGDDMKVIYLTGTTGFEGGITAIWYTGAGSVIVAGTGNGIVYTVTESGGTLVYDTGAAAAVDYLNALNNISFATVGNALYSNRGGTWGLEQTFPGETGIVGMAMFNDELWAGFASGNLWKYVSTGWVLYKVIADCDDLGGFWMGTATDGTSDALFGAKTDIDHVEIWRYEEDPLVDGEFIARYSGDIAMEALEVR